MPDVAVLLKLMLLLLMASLVAPLVPDVGDADQAAITT